VGARGVQCGLRTVEVELHGLIIGVEHTGDVEVQLLQINGGDGLSLAAKEVLEHGVSFGWGLITMREIPAKEKEKPR
jgi:hypothetical protein